MIVLSSIFEITQSSILIFSHDLLFILYFMLKVLRYDKFLRLKAIVRGLLHHFRISACFNLINSSVKSNWFHISLVDIFRFSSCNFLRRGCLLMPLKVRHVKMITVIRSFVIILTQCSLLIVKLIVKGLMVRLILLLSQLVLIRRSLMAVKLVWIKAICCPLFSVNSIRNSFLTAILRSHWLTEDALWLSVIMLINDFCCLGIVLSIFIIIPNSKIWVHTPSNLAHP